MPLSMQRYLDLSGNSGVTHYAIGADYVVVKFRGEQEPYRYSYARAGKEHIERMKALAIAGRGLATYISQNVHHLYDLDDDT
jgi:hypothetical protein